MCKIFTSFVLVSGDNMIFLTLGTVIFINPQQIFFNPHRICDSGVRATTRSIGIDTFQVRLISAADGVLRFATIIFELTIFYLWCNFV